MCAICTEVCPFIGTKAYERRRDICLWYLHLYQGELARPINVKNENEKISMTISDLKDYVQRHIN